MSRATLAAPRTDLQVRDLKAPDVKLPIYQLSSEAYGQIHLASKSEEGNGCPSNFLRNGKVQYLFELVDGKDLNFRDLFPEGFNFTMLPRFVTLDAPKDVTLRVTNNSVLVEFSTVYRPAKFDKHRDGGKIFDVTAKVEFDFREDPSSPVVAAIKLIYPSAPSFDEINISTSPDKLNGARPFLLAAADLARDLGPKMLQLEWVKAGVRDSDLKAMENNLGISLKGFSC